MGQKNKNSGAMQAMIQASKRMVLVCITPRAVNEDDARHEYILNIILLISFFFLIILSGTIVYNLIRLGNAYHGIPLFDFIILTVLCGLALIGSKRGHAKKISLALISIFTFGSVYCGWHWGASLPATLLSFALIVVISSVLIGSRFGFILSGILLVTLIVLGYHEIYFLKELPWKNETIDKTDIITYSAILIFIVGLTWLSNTEIEKSLIRARKSEKLLKEERDSLEIKVEERTEDLRRTQIERTAELGQMIEFGKLSQGLFHDLMNPLSGIMLHMNTVKQVSVPEITNAKEYIDKAVYVSKKMGVLLAEIKKKVRQSSNTPRSDVEEETYSIEDECDSVLHLYQFQIREAGIEVIKMYPHSGAKKTLQFGHSVDMYRIFSNIITNAIDALKMLPSETERKIHIEITKTPQNKMRIEISNNGPHIPEEIRSKIFEPFFTTKANVGGTGVGLSTVKNIVTNILKGTIEAHNTLKEDRGTTFTITFPVRTK
jgi:signal transduction histidine kinase